MYHRKPLLIATDLEGVLVPEIWIAVAEQTGIEQLRLTTRDISDYDELMRMRLSILREHGLRLADIQAVIAQMDPLPGAAAFLRWARERWQVIIVSDTFYEFAMPLMAKLDYPTLFCHNLEVDAQGMIVDYHLRIPHPKRRAVRAFRELGFFTFAMGDSYNDIAMISAADVGILFDPSPQVAGEHPYFPVARDHTEARRYIEEALRTPTLP